MCQTVPQPPTGRIEVPAISFTFTKDNCASAAITKLGETLQQLEILQIHPNVDYNEINSKADRVDFDFKEIFNKRGIRNALQKSFTYRRGYIGEMSVKIEDAENLIALIDNKLAEAD